MLREDLSDTDMESLLASLSSNRFWDANSKLAVTLSLHPEFVVDDVQAFIAKLDASLIELVASGSVNPVKFTVSQDDNLPNPATCSQTNWTALASLMHFLPRNYAPCIVPPRIALAAYDALVRGAEELVMLGYEAANVEAIIGRSMSFALAIGEDFVAWAAPCLDMTAG